MNQKTLNIIYGVVVLLILALAYFAFKINTKQPVIENKQPVVNEFAGWKLNKNPLGMPISYYYPADWEIQKNGELITGSVFGPHGNPTFGIVEERALVGLSLADAAKKDWIYRTITSKSNIKLGNINGYKVQGESGLDSYGTDHGAEKIYFVINNKIYSAAFYDWNGGVDITKSQFYPVYQKILSGLVFTE